MPDDPRSERIRRAYRTACLEDPAGYSPANHDFTREDVIQQMTEVMLLVRKAFAASGWDARSLEHKTLLEVGSAWGLRLNQLLGFNLLAVDNPQALQEASERLTPELLQKRFDYWTFLLGPKFSKRERNGMSLDRFYAFCQVEYCLNFIFHKTFPFHKLFERSCELGLLELTAEKISQIFGQRITRQLRQAPYHPRTGRPRSPCLTCLLQTRLCQTI